MTIERKDSFEPQHDRLGELRMPRPLNVQLDKEFIAFTARDAAICKFAVNDHDTMFAAVGILNGILSSNLCHAEIEQLRDLLLEVVGS